MTSFRTHYDNLKVARDAPDIVIRAAYKSLSQRYHPDKNAGDERSARVMAVINQSYEVLSDPKRRADHDTWIAREDAKLKQQSNQPHGASIPPQWQTPPEAQQVRIPNRNLLFAAVMWPFKAIFRLMRAAPQLAFFAILLGGIWLFDAVTPDRPPPPGPKPYTSTPATQPSLPAYKRPDTAPNGESWPLKVGYVEGYPLLAKEGLSEVTVDNRQNDSDVFVKLVSLDESEAFPVRQFYISAHSQFAMKGVSPGTYDIRYRDLDTGGLSRSEEFVVEQTRTSEGTQYSTITMTLYKVQDGNFQTFDLAESEF